MVKTILPFMVLSDVKFYYLRELKLIEVEDGRGRKQWIKTPMVKGLGSLQRFAVEWYYKNIYHQNFGGKEMAPYEVVLKNY